LVKVALQVEGRTDLAVFETFVRVIVGSAIDVVKYEKRAGGVHAVLKTLLPSAWSAWKQGCRGIVVAVDADDSAVHATHAVGAPADCRYCDVLRQLPAIPV